MNLQLLLLVVMAASIANCKKNAEASSNVSESELGFYVVEDDGISMDPSETKRENELSNCQEDGTRRSKPVTRWNRFSPNEEKSESSEEERSRWCNQSELSLHCSQDDECRSPGICQHISCHYPHVAEFRSIPVHLQSDSQFSNRSVFMTNTLAVIVVGTVGNLLTLVAVPYVRIR